MPNSPRISTDYSRTASQANLEALFDNLRCLHCPTLSFRAVATWSFTLFVQAILSSALVAAGVDDSSLMLQSFGAVVVEAADFTRRFMQFTPKDHSCMPSLSNIVVALLREYLPHACLDSGSVFVVCLRGAPGAALGARSDPFRGGVGREQCT